MASHAARYSRRFDNRRGAYVSANQDPLREAWELLSAELMALAPATPSVTAGPTPEGWAFLAEHSRIYKELELAYAAYRDASR